MTSGTCEEEGGGGGSMSEVGGCVAALDPTSEAGLVFAAGVEPTGSDTGVSTETSSEVAGAGPSFGAGFLLPGSSEVDGAGSFEVDGAGSFNGAGPSSAAGADAPPENAGDSSNAGPGAISSSSATGFSTGFGAGDPAGESSYSSIISAAAFDGPAA